ncbi:MAG TPA: holo-ACP synthase [Clostridiaceae bacterium]|nr:holo-ACP synthase [Clostridiaceae bacterium]
MKISCGLDLLEISRIERVLTKHGERFLARVYTPKEIVTCAKKAESYAGYFAAKEATAKALGTGLMTDGIKFTDIEILKDDKGAPYVALHDAAKTRYLELNGQDIAISITHERSYAAAVCYLLRGD